MGVFACAGTLGLVGHARAEESPLHLRVVDCVEAEVSKERLIELVRTEIAPRTLDLAGSGAAEDDLTCEVRLCDGAELSAALWLSRGGAVVSQRTVALADVAGDSRARTLAVVLAEMLATAGRAPAEVSKATETSPDTPSTSSNPPKQPFARIRLGGGRVIPSQASPLGNRASAYASAGAFARQYLRPSAPMLGPWVALTYRGVTAELVLGRSTSKGALGDINLSYVALATAFEALEISTKPLILTRIRLEGGGSWATGAPNDALVIEHRPAALTTAAMAEATLRVDLVRSTTGQIKAIAGYSSGLTATEDGKVVASTSGWILGVALGLDFALDRI